MVKLEVILFFAVIGFAHCLFRDCSTGEWATLHSVQVQNCENNTKVCLLKKKTEVKIDIDFTPKNDVQKVKAVVHGIVLTVPIPFGLPNDDGCVDSQLTCPLKANEVAKYSQNLSVLESYPSLSVDVKWELKDENNNTLVCVEIESKIVRNTSKKVL